MLARIRRDFGLAAALARHPTVLWLSASDTALRLVPLDGLVAAIAAAAGVASPVMLAAAWVLFRPLLAAALPDESERMPRIAMTADGEWALNGVSARTVHPVEAPADTVRDARWQRTTCHR
jgi:hypothetical protein